MHFNRRSFRSRTRSFFCLTLAWRRRFSIGLALSVALLTVLPVKAAGLKAGAATVNITPNLGVRINGGIGPGEAKYVHDDLFAKCLVLDDGTMRLAWVVVDACLLDREVFDEAKRLVTRHTGIPAENLMMSTTHTHSAGAATGAHLCEPDPTYRAWLPGRISDSVRRAANQLAPARIGWVSGSLPQHVFCRRLLIKPGMVYTNQLGFTGEKAKMNWDSPHPADGEPAGPTDPEVFAVSVQHADGRPLALLANYSLHYVGDVGPGHISADYFGVFADRMQQLLNADRQDPPFVAMLCNGTSGDINNVNPKTGSSSTGPYSQIRRVAFDLADEVHRRLAGLNYRGELTLQAVQRELSVAVRKPTPAEVEQARRTLGGRPVEKLSGWTDNYARETVLLADYPETVSMPMQVFRLGELAIAAWPAEIFASSGLELKRRSPVKPLFNIGLANGWFGYIAPPEQHALGAYETWRARTSWVETNTTVKMIDTFLALLGDGSTTAALATNTALIPVTKLENDSYDWHARHADVLRVKDKIDPEVVLIGDSITHFWGGEPKAAQSNGPKSWQATFGAYRTLNLGFGWDRIQNVLWRLDHGELDGLHPRVVVLHIGTNNTSDTENARKNSAAEIVDGIDAILQRLRAKVPGARVVLMAVFPREEKPDHPRRRHIAEINQRLAALAQSRNVTWLDIGSKLLNPDGTLSREIMSDFCHPTDKGYQVWGDALAPLLAASPAERRAPEAFKLWDGKAPVGDGQFESADVKLTLFRPARPNGAAVIICPGGGYGGLVTGPEGSGIAEWLNAHGIAGLVLEYRLPRGRSQVPLLDAQQAIRWTRSHAEGWGIDPQRIGIIGFSAGGHLASTAATHFDEGAVGAVDAVQRASCRPDFAVLVYPVVTMTQQTHGGSRQNLMGPNPSAEMIEWFSNEKQVTSRTPPTYLAHALDDKVVSPDNSRLFHEALKSHQIPTRYLELPSGDHGLNGYRGPMWDAWQSGVLQWLAELKLIPAADAETGR